MTYLAYLKIYNSHFFLIFFVLLSCNFPTSEDENEDLKTYLIENLKHSYNKENLYIFLSSESCSPCIEKTKGFLLKQKGIHKKIHIVFISNSLNKLKYFSKELDKKFSIIFDSENIGISRGVISKTPIVLFTKFSKPQNIDVRIDEDFEKIESVILEFINR